MSAGNLIRAAWLQINQEPSTNDLRGPRGLLLDDSMPSPSKVADMGSANRFDRVFSLKLNAQAEHGPLLLFISTSALKVTADGAP